MFDRGLPWEVPIWHLLVAAEVDERRNHIRDVRCHEDVVVTLARLHAERVERARLGNGSEGASALAVERPGVDVGAVFQQPPNEAGHRGRDEEQSLSSAHTQGVARSPPA